VKTKEERKQNKTKRGVRNQRKEKNEVGDEKRKHKREG